MNSHNGPNLLPLAERTTKTQQTARQLKREDRATFRNQISKEHAITRGMANALNGGLLAFYRQFRNVLYAQGAIDVALGGGLAWLIWKAFQ